MKKITLALSICYALIELLAPASANAFGKPKEAVAKPAVVLQAASKPVVAKPATVVPAVSKLIQVTPAVNTPVATKPAAAPLVVKPIIKKP